MDNIDPDCKLCGFAYSPDYGLWVREYEHWRLGLVPEQDVLGRLFAVSKKHQTLLARTNPEEFSELHKVLNDAQTTLEKAFEPDWWNIFQFGNIQPHLHVHVVPRYKSPRTFGGIEYIDSNFGGEFKPNALKLDRLGTVELSDYLKKFVPS